MEFPDLDQLAHRTIVAGHVAPAAAVAVATRTPTGWRFAAGAAGRRSARDETPADPGLVFDLASVSKPFVALCAARLHRHRTLDLDAPLSTWVSESQGTRAGALPLQLLLAHRAGLEAHRELFAPLRAQHPVCRREVLREAAEAHRPECDSDPGPEGYAPCYSDLGYMILEWLMESALHAPLDAFVASAVYGPLGVEGLFFPGEEWSAPPGAVAATEVCPWRNALLAGRVHDDNAGVVGGVAGHAGLFGTARGVHQLLSHMLGVYYGETAGGAFRRDLVRLFLSRRPPSERPPGFDRPEGPSSSAGRYFSPHTVGHLGFTGTSFWMDMDRRAIVVLLTNRVHPSRNNLAIRGFRPRIHDAVMRTFFRR